MAKNSKTKGAKRQIEVNKLSTKAKTLTTKEAKKVRGGLTNVMVTSIKSPAKSGGPTKLMEEEGIY